MADLFEKYNIYEKMQNRVDEKRENQLKMMNNFVDSEFLETEKAKGKITAFETLSNAKKWGFAIPYVGTGAEILELGKINSISQKVRDGRTLSQEETDTYKDFVRDMASQAIRGQTIPSQVFDGLLKTAPYMAEFGIGLWTSGAGVGLASLGQTGGKLAVKKAFKDLSVKAVKETTKEAVKKQIAKNTAKTLLKDSTIGVAKFNATRMPQQGIKRYNELEIGHNLMLTPEGKVILNESESKPATSALKAVALTHLETFSETTGFGFNLASRATSKLIAPKILNRLPDNFAKNFNKLSKQVTGLTAVKAIQKFGFNGVLEEFGEERVNDLLQVTFNLDNKEGYSFEQFLNAMFPPKEQVVVELLTFGLMGGGAIAVSKGIDYTRYKTTAKQIQENCLNEDGTYDLEKMRGLIKRNNPAISEKNLEKVIKSVTDGIIKVDNYSIDDFLFDSGIIRTPDRHSETDKKINEILKKQGVKPEKIHETLHYATLEEKAEILKKENKKNANQENYSAIKNDLINAGHSEEQAELEVQTLNRIDEILMDKYNEKGEAESLIRKRNLKIQDLQNKIQKANEDEYLEETQLKKKNIHTFKPSELLTDAKTFQYKENSDSEGRTDRMDGVEEWSANDSGIVVVWESKEGKRYIADGHQRLGLAKRLNDDSIRLDGLLFREVDGYTPQQVRMLAAQKNIAENSGTPIDTAKIIRELGGVKNYPKHLPRKNRNFEIGASLARLGEEAFEKVVNGVVTPRQGAVIADIIIDDHAKQSLAIDVVAKSDIESLLQVEMLARQILSTTTETVEQTNLFGTEQILQSFVLEKIKIVEKAIGLLKKRKNAFSNAINNATVLEGANNRIDKKTSEEIRSSSAIALDVISQQSFLTGFISDKANDLAQKVKNEEMTLNSASMEFADFCAKEETIKLIFGKEDKEAQEELLVADRSDELKTNGQIGLLGLEEESARSVKKQVDEYNAKKFKEEHSTTANGTQSAMFNVEQFKDGQQMLFDTSDMQSVEAGFNPKEKPKEIDKYEDFGEKIEGAKKDLWKEYSKSLSEPLADDFEKMSLTKDFPEPNYEMLIREGINVDILATIKALRDCVPIKPRGRYKSYKRKEYIEVLKFVRSLAGELISGEKKLKDIQDALNNTKDIKAQVELYIELGYPAFKNANNFKVMDGVTVLYKDGKKLETPLENQYCIYKNGHFIGNSFESREEAVEYLRIALSFEPEKQERKTKLDIYQVRKTGEIVIGKKVGSSKWIDLKGGFTTAKEARQYYKEHEQELLDELKKRKETPETRHLANKERVGEDYREGMNITPEKFANEFGFRGIQFGNYVEQEKRVNEINEAYDALLDLANLIDVPSRALSLNGSLGIAFGARGSGTAKAHFEPKEIVINLTKKRGAGSLAHEWWHALDNYFSRIEGNAIGQITEYRAFKNIRKEVFEAFKNITNVVSKNMYDRSSMLDMAKTKDYWSTKVEMTARAFEAYIISKAQLKGFTNDYLANILTEQEFNDIASYPYPLESEMQEIINAYDNLFSLLKTEETEKGIAFYQPARKPDYVDLTYEFDKVPTFAEVEQHLKDIINSGISFKTKTKGYKIDIRQTNEKRGDKKATNVVNKLTKKGNAHNQSVKRRNNKYLKAIEKLINNSVKTPEAQANRKNDIKKHVMQYHNFDVPVLIGETIYTVRLQAEEWKTDKEENGIKTVHLYNIYEHKKSSRFAQEDRLNNSTREDTNNISKTSKSVNIFEQSAYHGTPHKFEEFSTEHIGTGEGAQAHGWGLYFAGEKDVSERYRKYLTEDKPIKSVKYKGKEISEEDMRISLRRLKENGLNDALYYIQKVITFRLGEYVHAKELYPDSTEYLKDLEDMLKRSKEIKSELNNIDIKDIEVERDMGQLFEVDIPEVDVLLDEDKVFSEQPEKVQETINKIFKDKEPSSIISEKIKWFDSMLDELEQKAIQDGGYTTQANYSREIYEEKISNLEKLLNRLNNYSNLKGKDIYQILSIVYEGDKEASLLLNEYGIKGITYDGRQDGRCYVIFDDKAVKILEKYYQDMANAPRAKIEFNNNETIISLMQGNDASSVMHELAHLYLHDIQELAKTNKRAEKDLNEIYEVLNFNASDYTENDFIEMHENFARSFEAYLLNGEAPSQRMKTIFEKFKEFLKEVYESFSDLNVEFSKEVKECFDRLFTTDEEYEKEVLPLYEQNDELAESINREETLSHKVKNNLKIATEAWKSFYDTVVIPIETRLERISPELKKILRKHTFDLTYQTKKDCDKITPFLLKIKELKESKKMIELNEKQFNAYNLLSYALNNRDSYTVNKIVKILDIGKEFEQVRDVLEEIYEETIGVGLEVGYLESYYPRMVQTDKTEAFIDMFEKLVREEEIDIKEQLLEFDEAEYSDVKRTLRENDVHGLWNNSDKAKFINSAIRGFGKNNIMLSRIGQLKFERIIDKLTPEQQQFYEPIEKALSNYVIGARKNIEERKFFGAENKEVGKLRASIKRKRETLREVKERTPQQAKWKELNRLKYELAPIEIKLETMSGEVNSAYERIKTVKEKEEKQKIKDFIMNQEETLIDLKDKAERLREQIKWVEDSNALKVKNIVRKRLTEDIESLTKNIEDILGDIDHVEDSIGRLITDLAEKGIIHAKDEKVVRELLVARFNSLKLEKVATTARDASTIVTLNDITNAITQISDLTFSAFKFGLFNTFKSMKRIEGLTREDLGLKHIAEEFRGSGLISEWLNKQLKIIGLDLIDGFAKNTAINASVLSARQKVKKHDSKFYEKLVFLFGKNADKVKQDLIDGKITDEIIFIAFNDLADIQPITTDQMTRGYQSGFKPLYVLKTYSIKALDVIRNECFSKISHGISLFEENKKEGLEYIKTGLKGLVHLQMLFWLFGVPQDILKDILTNSEFDIPEYFIDNLLIFSIFNRYLAKKTADNPANIYIENVKLPILQAIGDLWSGVKQVQKGKKDVGELYVWSRVPVVGKLYYNWLGGKKNKRVDLR